MNKLRTTVAVSTTIATMLLAAATASSAQPPPLGDHVAIQDGPVIAEVEPSLFAATGTVTVSLELTDPSLAEAVGEGSKQQEAQLSRREQRRHVNGLKRKQREVADRVSELGAEELLATQVASNILVVDVDAEQLSALAADPEIVKILPVVDFELDLSENVPHIGATPLQRTGLTGKDVTVAVLDTGIDYTHAALGGPGTLEAYHAAYGTSVEDPANTITGSHFPTDKVIGGYDFVGESWPDGPITPDPDPIDCGPTGTPPGCAGGHGTNVADIIAGEDGVAPDAKLYAYKVCSAATCSGVAVLQAFEAALDPNGDGDISDAVDVINLSLGDSYGLIENSVSGAAANAVGMGVVVVAAAGNNADKPYRVGSPSSTPEVISVAETRVPSAVNFYLVVTEPAAVEGVYGNTNTVPWAAITDDFSGDVIHGSTRAQQLGCFVDGSGEPTTEDTGVSPYPAEFFIDRVALIDRGVCPISHKVHNAASAGAVGVIVAHDDPGLAPTFSFGGPDPFTEQQTLIVGQEVGNALRSGLADAQPVRVSVDTDSVSSLAASMVPTSSRGPSNSEVAIKPDIGAPGASVSAASGSGTGVRVFGGTSGAAPMVAGAAALLLEAYPDRSPLEIKAVLMNTAETGIYIQPAVQPGDLAEITRIGGGEVRVDRAYASTTAAWSEEDRSAGLSFGYLSTVELTDVLKTITVRNYSDQERTYALEATFRYEDDAASGAVQFTVPSRVEVPPGGSTQVPIQLRIDPKKLPAWQLNGGTNGADGPRLRENEFDGYITLTEGDDSVSLPWHVLPHAASNVKVPDHVSLDDQGNGQAELDNSAASGVTALGQVFALTGTSPQLPASELPGPGDGFAVADLAAVGVRADDKLIQFAISTYGDRAHPNAPIEFRVLIDVDQDGTPDYLVFNADLSHPSRDDGRNTVWVQKLGDERASAFYFVSANLNSANAILTAPLAELGLSEGDQFSFEVQGVDSYFTRKVTDSIKEMTFTVGAPRYTSAHQVAVPAQGLAELSVSAVEGGAAASPSQTGLLLMWQDGMRGEEAATITIP